MILPKKNLALLFRLFLIIFLSGFVGYLFIHQKAYYLGSVFSIVLIERVFNLVRYFNKTHQLISSFFLGIENEDSSLRFPKQSGNKGLDEVYQGMERLNLLFKETKREIRIQEQYYLSIIEQSLTGLFSVNPEGRVININPAAVQLTRLQEHYHVNALDAIDKDLPEFIMKSNRSKQTKTFENRSGQKLQFKVSEIRTTKEVIKLVAVGDITAELDNGEVDAWIKLARTLSHEIMNNITPITTLSKVILDYFTQEEKVIDVERLDTATIASTVKGLSVIQERGLGLMNFVEKYRRFTKLPKPVLSKVDLIKIIEHQLIAVKTQSKYKNIDFVTDLPDSRMITTDENLISQVITNLLNNACEALLVGNLDHPKLLVELKESKQIARIDVSNNGPMIPGEIREQIFIPFFTTKEEGSGVGLSLSKQIMLKLNGDVILKSSQENVTTFSILLTMGSEFE